MTKQSIQEIRELQMRAKILELKEEIQRLKAMLKKVKLAECPPTCNHDMLWDGSERELWRTL